MRNEGEERGRDVWEGNEDRNHGDNDGRSLGGCGHLSSFGGDTC